MRCRKNQATLTATERSRFVAAVIALKANGTYDRYVQTHIDSMMATPRWAHRGPAFLPWHREFLRRFELDLQAIDSSVTLPYWNWSVDTSPTSSLWGPDFMGGDGRPSDGIVITGPFAYATGNWPLAIDGPELRRRFGAGIATLPTPADVTNALAETPYDLSPYNDGFGLAGFRNTLEGWRNGPQLHNRVHVWVGGSMAPMSSPNDPVFFLNHCFIDKLWADWQLLHPTEGYLPISGAPAGHNLADPMQPWAGLGTIVTPASVLDHHALGYAYDTESLCAPTLKFLDDRPTLKIFDDRPTLKILDDQPTLKFRDDLPTLKFLDEIPGTLKILDDAPPTLKVLDDGPTLKFADDGGTLKNVDDVKLPAMDPLGPVKMQQDPVGLPLGTTAGSMPFVLSTPHHSMAWAQTFPGSLESDIAHLEMQIAQLQPAVDELDRRMTEGRLTEDEARQLEGLRSDLRLLVREREELARHVAPGSTGSS